MPLRIRYAKQEISDLPVSPSDTIEQLRRRIGERIHLHWSRIELRGSDPSDKSVAQPQRFTGELKPLSAFGKALTDTTSVVWVKDLGRQFSYRGVFLLEYGGPLALMLLFALRPAFLYSGVAGGAAAGALPLMERLAPALAGAPPSEASAQWAPFVQCLAVAMWLLHYLKRELETLFVHKFSRPFMPIFNLYKNCAYYWGFTLLVAYPLAHPQYTAPGAAQVAVGAALWLVSQALNLAVHLQLAGMRGAEGDDSRQPPEGWLFSLVTSPNYTTEALAWVGWSLVSNVAMGYVFTLAGLAQMAQWSLQKYRGYKESGDSKGKEYAQRRKAIIPFLL